MNRFELTTTAILGLAAFTPGVALPCGNAVMLETDEAARLVAKAETDLREGRYGKALGRLHHGDTEVNDRALQKRIDLVTSTARLRLGQVTSAAWSFDSLHQQHPDDPVIETRLGETLSRLGTKAGDQKALAILSGLETRDLMADEHGFLALAKLRDRTGDQAGRDRALERCRAMAKDASFCAVRPPKTKEPSKKSKAVGADAPTS